MRTKSFKSEDIWKSQKSKTDKPSDMMVERLKNLEQTQADEIRNLEKRLNEKIEALLNLLKEMKR